MSEQKTTALDASTFLQLQEEERQRLAHALTSGPGQVLANALMEIEYSLPLLQKNPEAAIAGLNALSKELRNGLAQLKAYVAELQPPLLDEMGLGASISQYVQNFAERTGIRAECRGCDQFRERYPTTIEITLFRILQEALANVQTHAQATRVRVELSRGSARIQLLIQDNGRGFTSHAQLIPKKRQLGMVAMRDRAELLGGQLQLFSEAGRGVRLVVKIPYHGHALEAHAEGGTGEHEHTNHNHTRARSTPRDDGKGKETRTGQRGKLYRNSSAAAQKRERQP